MPSKYQIQMALFVLSGFLLSACGVDPFSMLISNKMKDSNGGNRIGSCPQAMATTSLSTQTMTQERKVRVGPYETSEFRAMGRSSRLSRGTKLVATYVENCLAEEKSQIKFEEFELSSDRDIEDLEEEAQTNPCLLRITKSFTYKVNMTSNDPSLAQQSHFDAVRAFTAYDTFYHATEGIQKDMVIAVVDSGVDIDHEDLRANIWRNTRETAGNGIDDDGNGFVDDVEGWNFAARAGQQANNPRPLRWTDSPGGEVHGTHVAGLAASAWNNSIGGSGIMGRRVKIMAINVFGDSSGGSTSKLNQGIRYAADNGADIINLSLGACGYDQTTMDTILYAICKGSLVVTAAGNTYYLSGGEMIGRELSDNQADASNSCDPDVGNLRYYQTPASFGASVNGLISVGSADAIPDGSNRFSISDFSGWSTRLVEIAAPGSQGTTRGLYSSLPSNSYGRQEGTSMASPVVAAAAALAKSYADRKGVVLTPMNLERLIQTSGRVESLLLTKVKNGKHLDLVNLANEINTNINSYR